MQHARALRPAPLALAAALVAALALAVLGTSPAAAATKSTPTILDLVLASKNDNPSDGQGGKRPTDGNWYDTDILREAVGALGLGNAVAGLNGATVFAPTDRSFQLLVSDLTNTPFWTLNEAAVLATLVQIAGVPNLNGSGISGAAALTQTVLYHVSPENIPNLRARAAGANIATANTVGATAIDPRPVPILGWALLGDGDTNDADPLWYGRTFAASNGTVHLIQGVLRPLDLAALFPQD
jgi:hypothetical protein